MHRLQNPPFAGLSICAQEVQDPETVPVFPYRGNSNRTTMKSG